MIYVIATIDVHPGRANEFARLAEPCIAGTRAEAGCESYELHRALGDGNRLVFVERWSDRDALNAHFREPHLVTFRDAGAPMVAARTIEIIEPAKVDIV